MFQYSINSFSKSKWTKFLVWQTYLWVMCRKTTVSQWKQGPPQWLEHKLLVSCTQWLWHCLKLMSWFLLSLNIDYINLKEKPTYDFPVYLIYIQATPITAPTNWDIIRGEENREIRGTYIYVALSFNLFLRN